jgi:hypothetical protein
MSVRDTTLPKGGGPDGDSPVFIPAGTMVNYHIHTVHLREDLCGPETGIFNPDRWEESPPAWGYLPFSGGPKVCLGRKCYLPAHLGLRPCFSANCYPCRGASPERSFVYNGAFAARI